MKAAVLLLAMGVSVFVLGSEPGREGEVQYSNGDIVTGQLSLAPGGELKLHTGQQLQVVAFDEIESIELTPETEEMARGWRFVAAGQTAKEPVGDPYPSRTLRAQVRLAGNRTLAGHLFATALYLETHGERQKVILSAKQRGQPGDSLGSLVYPQKITFRSESAVNTRRVRVKFADLSPGKVKGLAALTRDQLLRLEAIGPDPAGVFQLPAPAGQRLFLAAHTTEGLMVGWPQNQPASLTALVQQALALVGDFFDERKLLGIFHEPAQGVVYSVVLLSRRGPTTLAAGRSQPWRLEVFRWRYDEKGQRLMLSQRGYFFRGLLAPNESPPVVRLSEALWNGSSNGDLWILTTH